MGKGGRPYKVHEDLAQLRRAVQDLDHITIQAIIQNHGIDAYDEDERTALIWACFFGQTELLHWLIKNDADVNRQDKIGYTGLHFCGQEKNFEVAKILLDSGADPNMKDQHGNAPLWTALFISREDFKVVKLLREYGADPKSKNLHGRSPDDLAMTIYQKDMERLIK